MEELSNKKVAILATDGFEEVELTSPRAALERAGAQVHIISEKSGSIKAWNEGQWSDEYHVDKTIEDAAVEQYDALVLPGGVINPDTLRRNDNAVQFIRSFFDHKKPVAAICHAPQLLAEADVLRGRKITSFNSIKTDMVNAGANWVNEEVVVDNGLVTSRNPDDLPAFNNKLVEEIAEGKHELQSS